MIGTPFEDESTRALLEPRPRIDPAQRDRARLAVLADVGRMLADGGDHDAILRELPALAVPAIADWCSVYLVDGGGRLELVASRAAGTVPLAEVDDRRAARVVACAASEAAADHVAVPLAVRGRVLGALAFGRRDCDRDDLAFGEELARRIAMYVDNALLLREVHTREAALRDEARRLETLNRIGQQLAAIHDLDEIVTHVCEAATVLTGAELGVYFTDTGGEPKHAVCGASASEAAAIAERRGELSRASPAFQLAGALRVDDVAHELEPPHLGAFAAVARVRSYLAVPVRGRGGDVIGGIALAHSRAGAFDARAEQLVVGLASLTATATDSARLFREARELIDALEKTNRELDQFAYVASHDLRAPLRGIANLARWIEEDVGDRIDERGREHLHLLHERVRRLEDLVQGVLDYSRAGREGEEPSELDVGVLVREVVELLAPPAHVEVRVGELPTLRSARVPLERVLMNLIANAIAHNDKPRGLIEIGAEATAWGWELFVRDNGPGIAARHHAQIWELFQTFGARDRLDSTGIGLAIVRKIVEAHGGRAWVESEEGRGATFRFTWPREPSRPRAWR